MSRHNSNERSFKELSNHHQFQSFILKLSLFSQAKAQWISISKTVSFIDAMVSRAIKVAAALTEVTAGSSKGGLTAEMLATMAMGETTAGAVHVAGTMHPHKSRK